ncbi:MAG: stage II sporulation protein M [Nanoarchaeota archaeon]|nr:stage II sporulation protein M [Nanoarchaeota archaeon]MBU4124315.1 stage II sporulation protein M [Nanoarchaeota archaeon]
MVLESIFSAKTLERKPVDMLFLSMIVTLVCIYVSYMIFPEYAGIIMPLLVTVTISPVMFKIFRIEEQTEREQAEHKINKSFWDRHDETIIIFTMFFVGSFLAVFFVAILAPGVFIEQSFSQQIGAINAINPPTASFTGAVISPSILEIIVWNNMKVMFFSFLLSFLIGTGALFILSWNASILAIYLASFIRQGLYNDFFLKSVGIAPHAPVEIFAYFFAGIAGGILSVGIIREKLNSREFLLVFKDSLIMLALAFGAVIFGGLLEVFI